MIRLALASIAATLLDIGTASPLTEINQVVLAVGGPTAMLLRSVAVLVGFASGVILWRTRYRVVAAILFAEIVAVGCYGAFSNVTA